jgi:hypothetical protein
MPHTLLTTLTANVPSLAVTGSAFRRIPRALYSCQHCAEDYSWPAEDLYWSDITNAWVCENCWEDDVHGQPAIRMDREIKRQNNQVEARRK